jgi:hypothetical protein
VFAFVGTDRTKRQGYGTDHDGYIQGFVVYDENFGIEE